MFNMFHSECFSCHKRAAAAIDRRINNGRLVERPPLFVAVLRCVFNAARELVQFHKELSTKKKRQEQELEELVALQEALMRERGEEGIVNDAKDSRGEELLDDIRIDQLMKDRDREVAASLKHELQCSMSDNRYASNLLSHLKSFE